MVPLVIQGLSKRFGPIRALDGVSFSVEAGEVFGYLGPNGAGKTTTSAHHPRPHPCRAGSVRVFGQDPKEVRSRLDVGYLPGEVRLYGDMSGEAILDHFAGFRPGKPPRLRATLVEALGLVPSDLGRPVKFLSHGTRQKIGLVAAMQHDPALLLLDEPDDGTRSPRPVGLPRPDPRFRLARPRRSVLVPCPVRGRIRMRPGRDPAPREDRDGRYDRRPSGPDAAETRSPVQGGRAARPGFHSGDRPAEIQGSTARLWVRGDVNPVLRRIAQADVERFVFPDAELEDIFLAFYERGPPDAGPAMKNLWKRLARPPVESSLRFRPPSSPGSNS